MVSLSRTTKAWERHSFSRMPLRTSLLHGDAEENPVRCCSDLGDSRVYAFFYH